MKQVARNIAFSLCLYSGQMCTTPRNVFISGDGMTISGENMPFDEVVQGIVSAVNGLLSDPARAAEVLGCIQNERTLQNIEDAKSEGGTIVRESEALSHEMFPQARIRSPLMLVVDAENEKVYCREVFGPVVYFVKTDSTDQSIDVAEEIARRLGAITCGVYSTDDEVLEDAQLAMLDAGVPVSCNLTGQIYVNQSAAFSDFHVSGCNPSGNATLCDSAYVANRFRIIQTRIPTDEE
jgi:phenylacetic acid degradation protein paaN